MHAIKSPGDRPAEISPELPVTEEQSNIAPAPPQPLAKKNGEILLWAVAGTVIIFLTIIRTLPWFPRVIPVSADDSWDLALNFFLQKGYLAGKDYIFTFGPLGFLYNKTYFPATFNLKLIFQALLTALTVLVLLLQAKKLIKRPALILLWLFSLITLYSFFSDVFFLAFPVLAVNQYFLIDQGKASSRPSFATFLLVALMAFSTLVKFTFFVANAWVLIFITIDQIFVKKTLPSLLILFGVVSLAVWLLSGQPLLDLPAYIASSLAVASGHSEAMSLSESGWQLPIGATIFATTILLLTLSILSYKRIGKAALGAVLAESGLFF